MARDFAATGDHRRQAEAIEMALELLPPGHKDTKADLRERLDEARTRAVEVGPISLEDDSTSEALLEAREALLPEDAREAVLGILRVTDKSAVGTHVEDVIARVVEETEHEVDLVREAIEDLLDEGRIFWIETGVLAIEGTLTEDDVGTAVLSVLSELSSGGRGGARDQVIRQLLDQGISKGDIKEAIDTLEESGMLEEAHSGQLRLALDVDAIEEVHHQVIATIEELDPESGGVLDARVERELTGRGWNLVEVKEALNDLVDLGEILRDGGEIRLSGQGEPDEQVVRDLVEAIVDLAGTTARPVPIVRALRLAKNMGFTTAQAHRAIEAMVDGGQLWRDGKGLHARDPQGANATEPREMLMVVVRELVHGHQGAPRIEVVDLAVSRGMDQDIARRMLEDLIDDGLVHDTGGGFLRPG
jgi:DNA-binding IclR family transcriptional regulator